MREKFRLSDLDSWALDLWEQNQDVELQDSLTFVAVVAPAVEEREAKRAESLRRLRTRIRTLVDRFERDAPGVCDLLRACLVEDDDA